MRALVARAMDHVAPFVASLAEQPASDVEGGLAAARAMMEPMPEEGTAPEIVLARLFAEVIPKSFNAAGPGYLAYIPGGGVFASAVADLVGDAVNRYVGVWAAAPALAQLEATCGRWLCDLAGYPPAARGLLTTGGSLANFTAVVTARVDRLADDFLGGTMYVSAQAHHSVHKAARLAGFPARAVRAIATDARYSVRVDAMAAAIAADRAAGKTPFLIVASAGTTNTGAIDDLEALADLAQRERMWLHVDAAYGGFFLLTARGRAAMRGIERADSITLDPHKALFLPYGNGALLVRDGETLRRAHELDAEYMPPTRAEPEHADFCAISPELSRDPRGLRLWLPLMLHGAAAFRAALDEKLDLAALATDLVRAIPHVRIVAAPQLTALAFRLEPPGLSDAERDALNTRWLDDVVARKRVFVRATVLDGRVTPRLCILSFRTHEDRVRAACDDLAAVARELTAS